MAHERPTGPSIFLVHLIIYTTASTGAANTPETNDTRVSAVPVPTTSPPSPRHGPWRLPVTRRGYQQEGTRGAGQCPLPVVVFVRRGEMSLRIKAVVDKFVRELKEALDADIQDRIMKEREMQSYIAEREREVSEREAAWKAELSRREAEITRQEARLKIERENLEKEKSVLMGTASNQDNQDGALEITVSGEKYRCLRFSKAKK
ncbi:hypothetical protein HU200_061788 [Digitaria exilis]|uniref:Uncharacterized protein n=1 Tax=Digitaria exilis TaxID=1010633 RepID=A0A835A8E9_9POAL|nr:hypothetical protein HU200_061788 [Digitaria exilis]